MAQYHYMVLQPIQFTKTPKRIAWRGVNLHKIPLTDVLEAAKKEFPDKEMSELSYNNGILMPKLQ